MYNTSDSVPREGEGGALGKLHRKVQAHIKLTRAKYDLMNLGPATKKTTVARGAAKK